MNTEQATRAATPRLDTGAAALWASAFVVMAMIITASARLGTGNAAQADVATISDLTVLTVSSDQTESVVAILDGRDEVLTVYGIEGGRRINLYHTLNVSDAFQQGQGAAGR